MRLVKKDTLWLGLVLGLLGPVAGLLLIYYVKFSFLTIPSFLNEFIHTPALITSIGSLSLLANAVLFTIFINTNRDHTAKGIFATTLVYGVGILLLKLL